MGKNKNRHNFNKQKNRGGNNHNSIFKPNNNGTSFFGFKKFNQQPQRTVITPERRKQLEEDRQKRVEQEKNFKCEFEKMSDAAEMYPLMNPSKQRVTYGMPNMGNTCFFNSVLQSLTHTVPLHNYCTGPTIGKHREFCNKKGCLLCTYSTLCGKNKNPFSKLEGFMRKMMPMYRYGQQEDAQEFLLSFMDHLIKSCFNHPNPIQKYVMANQNMTPIFQMFGFKTRSQVLCESCGYQSNTFTENCSLTLQIPRVQGDVTVQNCLNQFVRADRLSGENKYSCSSCKKKVDALKSTSIETSPNILIVDFVRYTLGRKNSEIIQYPKSFSLSAYMSKAIDKRHASKLGKNQKHSPVKNLEENDLYDLYALIVHQGSSRQFGHYYSYCRSIEDANSWYKCNDESVTRVNGIEGALNKQAYILFYQKRIIKKVQHIQIKNKNVRNLNIASESSSNDIVSTASQSPNEDAGKKAPTKKEVEQKTVSKLAQKQIVKKKPIATLDVKTAEENNGSGISASKQKIEEQKKEQKQTSQKNIPNKKSPKIAVIIPMKFKKTTSSIESPTNNVGKGNFQPLRKRLHPIIVSPQSKKRRIDAMKGLCSPEKSSTIKRRKIGNYYC